MTAEADDDLYRDPDPTSGSNVGAAGGSGAELGCGQTMGGHTSG
jgi:hypothetical protein